ncbi:Transcriptional regulatory protein YycF [Stieleria maiorica]|uniref:Transcriptional regulatory protein YycF n=1 Tax=Stieleria maiorica TaxID=2795974 RepID=A0A5B9ME40_9BACT|nr:response regulator [Stieleria maiorica]QEF98506.1 Transcriptional regulatory protein YycF [Stieleria maiorica]
MSHESKIVVIDDDRGIVLGVQMRLRHAGFDVSVAYDGTEGLELIRSQNPDLVLLDVQMPNLDGLAVLKCLREDPDVVTPPVIMLSASLQDQQTALDAGAHYFLTKPYRSSDLIDAIASVLPTSASV